jgi:uncharacterized protein
MDDFVMGNVYNHPSMEDLKESDAWRKMEEFKDNVDESCKDCIYIKFCRGGCPYNGIVSSNSSTENSELMSVDPQCGAYKMIFKEVSNRANKEFLNSAMTFAPENHQNKQNKFSIMDLMLKK